MKEFSKRVLWKRFWALFLAVCVTMTSFGPPSAVYGETVNYLTEDAFVSSFNGQNNTNFRDKTTLIAGKGRHIYMRFDLSGVNPETVKQMVLKAVKAKGNSNQFVLTRCSEYLRSGDSDSNEVWTRDNITYNNRPLDEEGTPVVTQYVSGNLEIDVTELLLGARKEGKGTVSLHITTDKVDDGVTAATEFHTGKTANPPHLFVTFQDTETAVPVAPVRTEDSYYDSGSVIQKTFKIRDAKGRYLKLKDDEGSFTGTDDGEEAAVFGLYIFDYTEYEDEAYTRTSYAVKCMDNGKYLSIQNYFDAGDEEKAYYNERSYGMEIQAEADAVNWNERFYIARYEESGTYTIGTHLKTLRDDPGFGITPVRMGEDHLYSSSSEWEPYRFTFETVTGHDPLEVAQKVDGTSVTLSWYGVNGDEEASHYTVPGSTVELKDGKLVAKITGLTPGEHEILVSYTENPALNQSVRVRIFNHPGITHREEDLKAMKSHIENREEPWYSDYRKLKSMVPDGMAEMSYQARAHEGVGRGNPEGHGNISDFEQSGNAAYFHALQWVITGDSRHAETAKAILNAWAEKLKIVDGRDRILGAAINSYRYLNAAEILKYYDGGYPGYSEADFKKFQDMAENVIYPVIEDLGAPMIANGNWDTAAMISMISIGVLCDNTEIYDRAVSLYQDIHVNGSIAVYVSDWGQSVESGRDQAHAQLGIGYMADVCEVAHNQGDDLYSLYDNRLAKAFNWAARYNLYEDGVRFEPLMNVFGDSKRGYWTSLDSEKINRGELRPVYELPLAHYSEVSEVDTTWMEKAAQAMRAQGYVHNDNLNFGTMTSYRGEATEVCQPYFQIRTRLEPWYQRTWSDVNKYGVPSDGVPETLNSYFTIDEHGEMTASAKKAEAPYYQLMTNADGTYSLRCVPVNRYVSVKEEKIGDEHVIRADAAEIGENEKFILQCTGAGFYYLRSPKFDNRIVTVHTEQETNPKNAVLTLRLGTRITDKSAEITNNEKLILIYNTKEKAEAGAVAGLAKIEIESLPDRTKYKTGEELDLTGMTVAAYGNNGLKRILGEDEYAVSGYDPDQEGKQEIFVTAVDSESGSTLETSFPVVTDENYITRVQGEDFSEKTGNVYVRENKEPVPDSSAEGDHLILRGASQGKFLDFSNPVDDTGSYQNGIPEGQDTATWKVNVPESGFYKLEFKYNNPGTKWNGHRNVRDERNCRVVINNKENFLGNDGWVGWMIFNVSGYNDDSFNQSVVQTPETVGGNTRWNNNYMNVWLEAGDNEITLGIQAPPGQGVYDGPNLDYFDITYIGDEYVDEGEIPCIGEDFPFSHPGIYYSMEDLEAMKAQKDVEGTVSYKGYRQLLASKYSDRNYRQRPQELLDVGPYNNPNHGGTEYTQDMMAAHYNALRWYLEGDRANAKKAIEILNDWTETLKTVTDSNDIKLRIALMGTEMLNAAELLKYVYNQDPEVPEEEKWQQDEIEAFEIFFREKLLSKTESYYPQANGNWDALIGAFNMAAAVYLEDADLLNDCLTQYYIGNVCGGNTASTGALPNYIYPTGEAQESSRDQVHEEMGLTGLSYQCSIAWNQGLNLFEAYDSRLLKGVVYHSRYNLMEEVESETFISDKSRGAAAGTFEILYQHYKTYRDDISDEDFAVLEEAVNRLCREGGIQNEVKENWNYYLAMIFSRESRPEMTGIAVEQLPEKTVYELGEELDLTGMKVVASYSNAVKRTLDESEYEVSGYEPMEPGRQTITVTAHDAVGGEDHTDSFQIEVLETEAEFYVTGIEIRQKPDRLEYEVGEELDPSGIRVYRLMKASTSDAVRKEEIEDPEEICTFSCDFGTTGKKRVTVSYFAEGKDGTEREFKAYFTVQVREHVIVPEYYTARIRVTAKPDKTVYQLGEELDSEGLEVSEYLKASPSSAAPIKRILSESDYETEYDFTKAGTRKVTVIYYGTDRHGEEARFTDSFTVTVKTGQRENSGGSGESHSDTITVVTGGGTWRKDLKGWRFRPALGAEAKETWIYTVWNEESSWYYFGEDGYMRTGWLEYKGIWYFLKADGRMACREWLSVDGKWYYFDAEGGMLANTVTPDGYRVDVNGAWIE